MKYRYQLFASALVVSLAMWGCNAPTPTSEVVTDDAGPIDVVHAQPGPILRYARDHAAALREANYSDLDLPMDGPWTAHNGATASYSEDALVVTPSDSPGFVQIPVNADANRYDRIEIEMRVDAGAQCLLKWATAAAPDFARNAGVYEPIIADGAFHTYSINLKHYSLPEWSGWLQALEFWPAADTATRAEIRRVHLVRGSHDTPRRVTMINQTHEAVFGSQPAWRVRVPENGRLSAYYGLLPEVAEQYGSDGARFVIRVRPLGGLTASLMDALVNPAQNAGYHGWNEIAIDLNAYAGQEIDLNFEVQTVGKPDGNLALWGSPTVSAQGRPDTAPPVIFISLDTLRADHLSAYGYERETSPNIDRLAEDAVLFEHAIAPEPWTLPSHMTMFTGLYPKHHGVTGNALLPESRLTLGDALSNAGYLSAGFTGLDWWLMPFRGFAQGFDLYNHARPTSRHIYDTMPLVTHWLEQHDTNRFFLFFHAFDIHSKVHSMDAFQLPYETGDPSMVHFSKGMTAPTFERPGLETRATHYLQRGNEGLLEPTQAELDYMIAVYDDCIRMVDIKLGELFDSLRERGLYDDALIILVADHGESFFEHRQFLHQTVYEENCHVPFILKLPGNQHAGTRIADQVVLADLLPTVLDVMDIESTAEFDGKSLLPLIDGESESHPLIYVQREDQQAIRTNAIKRVQYTSNEDSECYDLVRDPTETTSVCDLVPEDTATLFNQAHAAFFAVPSGGWHIAFAGGDDAWTVELTVTAESRISRIAFLEADRRDDTLIERQNLSDFGFSANVTLKEGGAEECVISIEQATTNAGGGTTQIPQDVREQLEAIGYGGAEIEAALASGRAQITLTSDEPFYVNDSGESVTSYSDTLDPFDTRFIATGENQSSAPGRSVRIWYSPPSEDDALEPLNGDQLHKLSASTVSN